MHAAWMWCAILGHNRPYWKGLTAEVFSPEQATKVSYDLFQLFCWEFASLIALMVVFQLYGCPIFRQLSFILQRDWKYAITLINGMFIMAVSAKLVHFGYDFSFQFKWLRDGY